MYRLLVAISLVLLVACSSEPRKGPPAPIISKPAEKPSTATTSRSGVVVSPYRQPAAIPIQQQRAGKPVELLLARADAQMLAEEYAAAADSLERALRIESRNAQVWHQLAKVKMHQQQPGKALSLAEKSNRYAAGDRSLKYKNWKLIADIHRTMGNSKGVKTAERKAAIYR